MGKTAVAEALAQRIVAGDVPTALEGRSLMSLDLGALIAGVWAVWMFSRIILVGFHVLALHKEYSANNHIGCTVWLNLGKCLPLSAMFAGSCVHLGAHRPVCLTISG